jgi:hypothetical protein
VSDIDLELWEHAWAFADDIADLLVSTVVDDAPIRLKATGTRVVVAAYNEQDDRTAIPLLVNGEPRYELRVESKCVWDSSGAFLAVDESQFKVALHGQGEPIVRIHYRRRSDWGHSHIHVHAESAALGYGLGHKPLTSPPKTQILHVPTGSRRFRPCLEDMVEFLVKDLQVDKKPGWQQRVDDGRARWHRIQLLAAIRDAIRADPDEAPMALRGEIDRIVVELGAAESPSSNAEPQKTA